MFCCQTAKPKTWWVYRWILLKHNKNNCFFVTPCARNCTLNFLAENCLFKKRELTGKGG